MRRVAMLAVRDVDASAAWYARVLGCGVDDARELVLRDPDGFRVAVTGR